MVFDDRYAIRFVTPEQEEERGVDPVLLGFEYSWSWSAGRDAWGDEEAAPKVFCVWVVGTGLGSEGQA